MKKFLILSTAAVVIGFLAILSHGSRNPQPPDHKSVTHQVAEPRGTAIIPVVVDAVPDTRSLEFEAPRNGEALELPSALTGKRTILENCQDVAVTAETDSGRETLATTECDRVLRFDEPYDSMSRIELGILAETDAVAAIVLADRLAQKYGSGVEIVTRMYLHALALSAHPDVFESLYNYVNGGHGVVYTNGELNVARTADAYVWSRVGNNFGYTSDDMVEVYRRALVEQGYQADELEQQVEHWTTAIADRRAAIGPRGVQ